MDNEYIKCPNCGAVNPKTNDTCYMCSAKLMTEPQAQVAKQVRPARPKIGKNPKIAIMILSISTAALFISTVICALKLYSVNKFVRDNASTIANALAKTDASPTEEEISQLKPGMSLDEVETKIGVITLSQSPITDSSGNTLQLYTAKLQDGKTALITFSNGKYDFSSFVD